MNPPDLAASRELDEQLVLRPIYSRLFTPQAWLRYLAWAICALLCSIGALLFKLSEDWAATVNAILSGQTSLGNMTVSGIWTDLLPALWIFIILTLALRLRDTCFPGSQGSGIPQVMATLSTRAEDPMRQNMLSLRILIGKILLLVLVIIGGATVGRQGPSVYIGACIMFLLAYRLPFPTHLIQSGLITAGGAAGVAAAFNTPIAAIVFAVESISHSYHPKDATTIGMTVGLACIVGVLLYGNYYFYGYSPAALNHYLDWLYIIPIAVAGGLLGGLFARIILAGSTKVSSLYRSHPWRLALVFGLGCAIVGLLSGGLSYGSGHDETHQILHGDAVLPWHYPVFKAVSNGITLISGIPGGLFDPSLSIGAALGQQAATLLPHQDGRAIILMFMVAYFTGVVQSPFSAFVIVVEMTGAHQMILPLCFTAMIACHCSKFICNESLYVALAKQFLRNLRPGS